MRPILTCLIAAVLLLVASSARAEGLFYQLPADGTWAKYDLKMSVAMGEHKMQGGGSLRMASVGQSVEKDEPCRWIEIDLQMEISDGPPGAPMKQRYTVKVLIPEKHLKAGASPLDHMVRGWIRERKRDAEALADPKDFDKSPLHVLMAGPLKDVKRLEPIEVESKLGKLSCGGSTGTLEVSGRAGQKTRVVLQSRRHPKAPFGVVTSQWTAELMENEKVEATMTMEFKLSDLGTGAKSELPEQK